MRTASQKLPGESGQKQMPKEDENLIESLEFGNQEVAGAFSLNNFSGQWNKSQSQWAEN